MHYANGTRTLVISLVAFATLTTAAHAQTAVAVPWASEDIGSPAIAGSVSVSSGTYTITAAGADIWGTGDQFRFVYQPMTGDGEVVARVTGVTAASTWSKAGVMMRETLTSGSKHAYALVSAAKGVAFQQRVGTGGTSTSLAGTLSTPPRWVRLVRSGSNFQAYESADGQTWQSLGTATINMASTIYVGLAVTSHNISATTTATISNVVVQPAGTSGATVPAPWTSEDVGAPAVAGSASYDTTTAAFTAQGAGVDIWGTGDQFHFVHLLLTGDGEVVARVASVGGVTAWSKAGVMIREDLSAGSTHALALVSASKGVAFQRRPTTGGTSLNTAGSFVASPYWVRLVRTGDVFQAYEAADGAAWKLIGSETISMLQTVYVGLAVTSHDATAATTAVFSNVKVTSSSGNQPPAVALTSPTNGATFTAPASVTITASASDPDGTVSSVAFYHAGTLVGTATTSPYSVTWTNVAAGTYSLTAVATDNAGATTTSTAVGITVSAATNKPPSVSLTSPVAGATFSSPTTVTLAASASDADGTIQKVDFYAGSTLVGTDAVAPYSINWSNAAPGSYSLTAVATDNSGATTRSTAVSVTLNPTRASFTPSPDDATLVTSYRLDIFPSGADPNTAPPVATQSLGKPTPVNGTDTVDITATLVPLAPGNYIATVSAIGSGGSSRSATVSFVR